MARPMRSVQRHRQNLDPQPQTLTAPDVPWSATLVQPETMTAGSTQPAILDVTAPVVLDGPVEMHVGSRSFTARWEGEADHQRRAVATLSGLDTGSRQAVRLTVVVRVGGTLLDAGKVIVIR